MNHLRYQLIGLFVWLFFLYNVEKVSAPINLSTFVYIFTAVCVVLAFLFRPLRQSSLIWWFGLTLTIYVTLKIYYGLAIGGTRLPITVTEIASIWLTIALSVQIGRYLDEVWESTRKLIMGPANQTTYPFNRTGQHQIYKEINRARLHQRPTALLAVSVTKQSLDISVDRFIQEVQQETIQKIVSKRVADLLVNELEDPDIVTQRGDDFIILLPEASKERALRVANKLITVAREKLGLEFQIGSSTFPDEAVTFEGLLERAIVELNHSSAAGDRANSSAPASSRENALQV